MEEKAVEKIFRFRKPKTSKFVNDEDSKSSGEWSRKEGKWNLDIPGKIVAGREQEYHIKGFFTTPKERRWEKVSIFSSRIQVNGERRAERFPQKNVKFGLYEVKIDKTVWFHFRSGRRL